MARTYVAAKDLPYSKDLLEDRYGEVFFERQAEPLVIGEDVIPTPLATWNAMCRGTGGGLGLARGWHVILAGNTGFGKTLAALNVAASAIRAGVRVGFVSLELSPDEITTRLYSVLAGVPVRFLERGPSFSAERAAEARTAIAALKRETGARFFVNDEVSRPLHELADILALMESWHQQHGIALYVVDYLQLAGVGDSLEIAERVTRISRGIRLCARTKRVVTLGLSQFNRATSANYRERPTVQGLFGASGLESDADQVLLLDHSRHDPTEHGARTWLVLGKNRHGRTTEIPVAWDYGTLRLREALPDEEADWPGVKAR